MAKHHDLDVAFQIFGGGEQSEEPAQQRILDREEHGPNLHEKEGPILRTRWSRPRLTSCCALRGSRLRRREVEALSEVAADQLNSPRLLRGLHAFGNRGQTQVVSEVHHRGNDGRVLCIAFEAMHEGLVHLQLIDPELPQVAERRVPGSEVVDGKVDAELP